jgi:hypothetical protein
MGDRGVASSNQSKGGFGLNNNTFFLVRNYYPLAGLSVFNIAVGTSHALCGIWQQPDNTAELLLSSSTRDNM